MLNFPALCVDNFYEDPDSIRRQALEWIETYPFIDTSGRYPGKRCVELHNIDKQFFDAFCRKIFSLSFDLNHSDVRWVVETSFQLIPPYSEHKNSIKNVGWIHLDDVAVAAGVIFLTPNASIDSGTSVFNVVSDNMNDNTAKSDFYSSGIDNNYDDQLIKHNSSFIETVRFNNIYNRLIMFDGSSYHGVNSFWTGVEPRLTQVFFIKRIEANSLTPIKRCRSF